MEVLPAIIGLILLVVIIRVISGSLDADRVEQHIHSLGGRLVDRSWDPFGPGWFGEKDARIYAIIYEDKDGNTRRAHVKTSMFSGVYLTNDRIIKESPNLPVEEEKARLRERLAELERQSPQSSDR